MHTKGNKIEIMMGNETDQIIGGFFEILNLFCKNIKRD